METGATKVPLRAVPRKSRTSSNGIQEEMRLQAVSHSLWVAIYEAQQAGLNDLACEIAVLHSRAVRQLRDIREAA